MDEALPSGMGSSFSDFLREEDAYEEMQAVAIKRVLAYQLTEGQLTEGMKAQGLTKVAMMARMGISRSQLDRLHDPSKADAKLDAPARAARAVGRELKLELAA